VSLHGVRGGRRGSHGTAMHEGRCSAGSVKEEGRKGKGAHDLVGQMAAEPNERKRKREIYF
jgi:hypothetical protein